MPGMGIRDLRRHDCALRRMRRRSAMRKVDRDGREVRMTRREVLAFFGELAVVSALWGTALVKLWRLLFG